MVLTFIQPERVFVWRSKERAPKQGRRGNLEKKCSGLEQGCYDMEKRGKLLEKKIQSKLQVSYSEVQLSELQRSVSRQRADCHVAAAPPMAA